MYRRTPCGTRLATSMNGRQHSRTGREIHHQYCGGGTLYGLRIFSIVVDDPPAPHRRRLASRHESWKVIGSLPSTFHFFVIRRSAAFRSAVPDLGRSQSAIFMNFLPDRYGDAHRNGAHSLASPNPGARCGNSRVGDIPSRPCNLDDITERGPNGRTESGLLRGAGHVLRLLASNAAPRLGLQSRQGQGWGPGRELQESDPNRWPTLGRRERASSLPR
jgi:hypothetical protein